MVGDRLGRCRDSGRLSGLAGPASVVAAMTDLITRLEQAAEGSRELDAEIAEATGWCFVPADTMSEDKWLPPDWNDPPAFSTSLDAALTLVPEGYSLHRIDQYHDPHHPAWGWGAHLRPFKDREKGMAVGESRSSAALALCIAALRART